MSTKEITSTRVTHTDGTPQTENHPRITFRPDQGLWELTHGDAHLYCASLPHAVDHVAAASVNLDPTNAVEVRTGDSQVDDALARLAELDSQLGDTEHEIAATRREVLRLVEEAGLPIGSGDLSVLLTCPRGDLVPLRVACAAERTANTPWCPFDPDHWNPVRVGPSPTNDATERLVAATIDGDAACMVVDLDRRRNRRLLRDGAVNVAISPTTEAELFTIDDIEPLDGEALTAARRVAPNVGAKNSLVHAHRVDQADQPAVSAEQPVTLVVPVSAPRFVVTTRSVVRWLAERLGCAVEYVFVTTPDDAANEDVREFATNVLAQVAVGVDAKARVVVTDDVAAVVTDVCHDRFTCMETHASPFRHHTFVGSFAAALLATTSAPVVLIGPAFQEPHDLECEGLSIAIAGEAHESHTLDAALAWAERMGLPAEVVHVDDPADDPPATDEPAREKGLWTPVAVRRIVATEDELAQALADAAGTNWLAVGTHARRGLDRIAQGSVAFDIAAVAPGPVIAFGPDADGTGEVARTATAGTTVEDVESLVATVNVAAKRGDTADVVMTPAAGWLDQLEVPWG